MQIEILNFSPVVLNFEYFRFSYLNDGGAFGVDDPLGATWEPIYLSLGISSSADGHDFLNAGHIFATAILDSLSEILQADGRGAVVCSALVVGRRFQILGQIRLQAIAACEVRRYDTEQSPSSLTALWVRAFVVRRLFHQLTKNFISQCFIFVTMLKQQKQQNFNHHNVYSYFDFESQNQNG